MPNPPFNKALRAAAVTQQSMPPTRFEGVTARVFPLRANLHRLAVFCDSYLNVAPEITRFRPMFPFVYLMALDYGKMSMEAGNLGWVSQHEVAFAVPLEWLRVGRDGRPVTDWALVCPFIFVDDELSLSTGREVYGWPKVRAWLSGGVNPWISNPLATPPLMALSIMVYPELYAGRRQRPSVFLEIVRDGVASFSRFPPNPRGPLSPFTSVPEVVRATFDLYGAFTEMALRPPLLGPVDGPPGRAFADAWRLSTAMLGSLDRAPCIENVTLKQFRDAERPGKVCYQALLTSQMRVNRFNGGGMLGDARLLAGDPSGGHSIYVRRYGAQPVVESLGLEVADELVLDDVAVAVLKPLFPFWVGVDLQYGIGNTICWRTIDSPWLGPHGHPAQPLGVPGPTPKAADVAHRFNTTLGAALQDVTGPFTFPDVTLRVLPLMADPNQMKAFCKNYLDETPYEFEAWGSYVYLVISNFAEMSSATDNIGWWADRELTFYVPVKRRRRDAPGERGGELLSVGLIPAFTFANTNTAAITGSEVSGRPTFRAVLESPPNTWMTMGGPADTAAQPLLAMSTMVFPALGFGQKAVERVVLEIRRDDALPHDDAIRWHRAADHWGRMLLHDHGRKCEMKANHEGSFENATALAFEVLTLGQPFNTFTLKQFRDAANPNLACYQAVVQGRRTVDQIYDLREIDELLHVALHRYPNQPIQEILGLRRKTTEMRGSGAVDILQPIRPFWMRVALREDQGQNLYWRAGSESWQRGSNPDVSFATGHEWPTAGPRLLDYVDERRTHMYAAARDWKDADPPRELSLDDVRRAVETIDPQLVVEAILSRGWGNRGTSAAGDERYRADFWIRCDSLGPDDGPDGPASRRFPTKDRTNRRWYSAEIRRPPRP